MSKRRFTVTLTVAEFDGLAYALSAMEAMNEEFDRSSDLSARARRAERNAERAFAKIKAARYAD